MIISKCDFQLQDLEQKDQEREEELAQIRLHAKTILEQRNEVEQYFLDAMAVALENQRLHRKQKLQSTKIIHNHKMRSLLGSEENLKLPPIAGMLEQDEYVVDGIDLRYDTVYRLTGMVRLQLLRLLYAKINNSKSAQQLPHRPHSFAIDIDSTGQIIPVAHPRRKKLQQQALRHEDSLQQQLTPPRGPASGYPPASEGPSFFITDNDHNNVNSIM